MPESALSRLARSTKFSKTESAFRLSGAHPVQSDSCTNLTVLETLQPYWQRKTLSIAASHRISTRFPQREMLCRDSRPRLSGRAKLDSAEAFKHAAVCSSARPQSEMALNGACFSGRANAEDRKLIKELTLGGPCFEGTLQESGCCTVPESQPRGRGQFLGVIF
jgi:hypothetical protein